MSFKQVPQNQLMIELVEVPQVPAAVERPEEIERRGGGISTPRDFKERVGGEGGGCADV